MKLSSFVYCLLLAATTLSSDAQLFNETTESAGINFAHQNSPERPSEATFISGGGAIADYDFDGYPDLYLTGGSNQANAMYKNNGFGRFSDVAAQNQVDLYDILGSGPVFADVDGDFDLDLLVFSVNKAGQITTTGDSIENRPRLFINLGNGSYMESMNSGFTSGMPSYMGTFADFDQDGDLDLFMTHWGSEETTSKQLFWQNDGTGSFTDVTIDYLGITQNVYFDKWTFTPNITDINEDGWLDVLLTSDFGTSRIIYSNGIINNQLTFSVAQPPFITDENGMGAAVADYDNDGDLDWFVTSIWDPNGKAEGNWGISGNRLYRNTGGGMFEDATDEAGLRFGYWGWGACFADFNNDGHLDIYHENGFYTPGLAFEFLHDPARLYISNGDGTFTENAQLNGLNHTDQGRGVGCFDFDLDGDIDIIVMPNNAPYKLYRNISGQSNHYLDVKLFDTGTNPYALGARIQVTTPVSTQTREVSGGNNYASNNPLTQHFGLGAQTSIQSITVTWPDGYAQELTEHLAVNQITSIGRQCHTKFMTHVLTANEQQATLELYLQDLNGNPLDDQAVTMQVAQGPNAGQQQTLSSDANGVVTFQLNYQTQGTDRITYEFNHNGTDRLCRGLVRWYNDMVFNAGFEAE